MSNARCVNLFLFCFFGRNLIPTFSHIVLSRARRVNPMHAWDSSNFLEVARTVTNRREKGTKLEFVIGQNVLIEDVWSHYFDGFWHGVVKSPGPGTWGRIPLLPFFLLSASPGAGFLSSFCLHACICPVRILIVPASLNGCWYHWNQVLITAPGLKSAQC